MAILYQKPVKMSSGSWQALQVNTVLLPAAATQLNAGTCARQ